VSALDSRNAKPQIATRPPRGVAFEFLEGMHDRPNLARAILEHIYAAQATR
jgi:hypothetical protein